MTYQARYGASVHLGTALHLLVADPDNPRSPAFQFARAAALLGALEGGAEAAAHAEALRVRAEGIVASACEGTDQTGAAPCLVPILRAVEAGAAALSDEVKRRFLMPPHPRVVGSGGRMILRLRHMLTCAYDPPVAPGAYLLHLRPRALASQRVLDFALTATPAPSRQRDGADHFGNPVTWLFHDEPHARLEITSEASVELLPRSLPAATPPWEQVADGARNQAWAWREAEFMFPSPFVPPLPEARLFAAPSFAPGRPIGEAVACLARRIGQEFRVQSGAPTVSRPLACVLERREGICQDLAHVMIAGLRGLGLPARSVSGCAVARAPHAWVGCWLGPGLGWLDLDPTAGRVIGQDCVCLAWGRDCGDVSPMRGVLLGGGAYDLSVSVDLEPSEGQDSS